MTDLPRVSVVSAFYNRGSRVRNSVGSVLAQTYPNLEVVIVDDGSTDDTLAQLQAFDDPRLTVISRGNRGFVASINDAIRASSGAFVAIHGSGDLSFPDRVARQAQVLIDDPAIGVVGCWVEDDETVGDGTLVFRPPAGLPFHEALLTRNLFTHGETMFRRALYDQVGGYREFFRYAQDRDLWLRISRHADYAIVPDILYRRFKPAGGVSADPQKLVLQAYLSDFAVQCARAVDRGEADPLDRHGYLAPFLRQRPEVLGRKLAWFGARLMVKGDFARGWPVIEQARSEAGSWQVRMIHALAGLHRSPLLWERIGRPILTRRLAFFRQSDE
ncbi:glycosyltransferase [Sphingomonas sp. T9W2]|uniref:glycosyltransferase n=1 Tax=Sphingomonas sp. T9W2 TaxID=3143183 RepID=UPI0031F49965